MVDYVSGSFYFIVFTIAETFFKFIILYMREERKKASESDEENDTEQKSFLPPWLFTFSLRKMDIICCSLSFFTYVLYIIVFFASQNRWGRGVQFNLVTNGTTSGEL